jgi:hypothetical protein
MEVLKIDLLLSFRIHNSGKKLLECSPSEKSADWVLCGAPNTFVS